MPIYTCEADKNLVIHFGYGDVIISTNTPAEGEASDEVIITPSPDVIGEIGGDAVHNAGKHTGELPPGVRLVFDRQDSIQVLIDALEKLKTDREIPSTG